MSSHTSAPQRVADLLEEHAELNRRLDEFQEWRAELCQMGQPRFGEMGTRLQGIRQLLADHFAAEEEGGYLADALRAAPQFTRRADELRQQHQGFLSQLDELSERLTSTPVRFTSWNEACREFDRLLTQLQEHEHAENEIVQSAFEIDTGNAN